jgi:hypothetical protein
MTLDFNGDGLLGLTVDGAVLVALVQNSGTITVWTDVSPDRPLPKIWIPRRS